MIGFSLLLVDTQARWYLKAAEGGYVRAMYNASVCYTFGEGLSHSRRQARKWMKRAADRGHSKAQFEHGLALFSVCHILIFLFISINNNRSMYEMRNIFLMHKACYVLIVESGWVLIFLSWDSLKT